MGFLYIQSQLQNDVLGHNKKSTLEMTHHIITDLNFVLFFWLLSLIAVTVSFFKQFIFAWTYSQVRMWMSFVHLSIQLYSSDNILFLWLCLRFDFFRDSATLNWKKDSNSDWPKYGILRLLTPILSNLFKSAYKMSHFRQIISIISKVK